MSHKIVLIHSKPGLGKSTLAKSVVTALNAAGISADRFSMGDTLRSMAEGSIASPLSIRVQQYQHELSHHLPIPDGELTADIVAEFCAQSTAELTVIDGYPRYGLLLPGFERICKQYDLRVLLMAVLEGSDELAADRIAARNRTALGVAENATQRLKNYVAESAPIVAGLATKYPTIYIDAERELIEKTNTAVEAITAHK